MMVPCAFTPSPIETIVLLASDNCQFLCFAFFFFSVVILRNYNNLFSIVWFRFCGSHFFDFVFFSLSFSLLLVTIQILFTKMHVCVCWYICVMTFNIVSVSNSIWMYIVSIVFV